MGVNVFELTKELDKIRCITNEEWMQSLEDRKQKELEFHDLDRDRTLIDSLDNEEYERRYGNRRYYCGVQKSRDYVSDWIDRNAPGKVFLDYACGNGGQAVQAAKAGAALAVGIDISPISVRNGRAIAEKERVTNNTYFLQGDAENTRLPAGCIETVICSGMLHHLDLSYAFPELRRIMAPDARLLAVEALNYNPIIRLYRQMTPEMRTEWEKDHILDLKDVSFASRFFAVENLKFWHITSMLAAFAQPLLPLFDACDAFFARIPGVQLMAWQFTFELVKRR